MTKLLVFLKRQESLISIELRKKKLQDQVNIVISASLAHYKREKI